MKRIARVFGIDPGLVHTGIVRLSFYDDHSLTVKTDIVNGLDAEAVKLAVGQERFDDVFIEKYEPRKNYGSDVRMLQGQKEIASQLDGSLLLRNMGVTRTITPELMKALELYSFKKTTHHQDLRSAARIALLGMVRDPRLNVILANVVRDYLDGNQWVVEHE